MVLAVFITQVLQAGFAINNYVVVLSLVELMTLHFFTHLTLHMQVQLYSFFKDVNELYRLCK